MRITRLIVCTLHCFAACFAAWGLATPVLAQSPRPQPPYRLLYSSDLTHILTNTSPYHRAGGATLDAGDAAGVGR